MRGDGDMGEHWGHGRAWVHRGAWGNMGTGRGTARWGWDLGAWRGHSRVMLKTRGEKTHGCDRLGTWGTGMGTWMGTQKAGEHMAGADWDISEGTWGHGGYTTGRGWGHRRQGWEHGQESMGTSLGGCGGMRTWWGDMEHRECSLEQVGGRRGHTVDM